MPNLGKRRSEDIGSANPREAARYIYACDYKANNEYICFAHEIVNHLSEIHEGVLVDIGCGPGTLCEQLRLSKRFVRVVGIDSSSAMVSHAALRYAKCSFVVARAEHLPFPDNAVDVAVCQNALHHFQGLVEPLSEMLRTLRPGGVAVLRDLARDADDADVAQKLRRMHPAVRDDFLRSVRSAFRAEEVCDALKEVGADSIAVFREPPNPAWGIARDPFRHESDWPLYYTIVFKKALVH